MIGVKKQAPELTGAVRYTPEASAAADAELRRQAANAVVVAMPWALLALVVVSGWVAHALWSGTPQQPPVVVGLAAATVGLAALAWQVTHDRGQIGRWHVTLNVAGGLGWVTCASVVGVTRSMVDVLIVGGGSLAFAWNLRHGTRSSVADTADGDAFAKAWEAVAAPAGLPQSRWRTRKADRSRLEGTVRLPGGSTGADAAGKAPQVASALGVAPGAVRGTPSAVRADEVDYAVSRVDRLAVPGRWEPPATVGMSITDAPLTLGVYEDGEPAVLAPVGLADTDRAGDIWHLLIAGMTGSGKSIAARAIAVDLASRHDVVLWAVDVSKGRQTLGCLDAAIDWFATDDTAARNLQAAALRIVRARADWLGRHGLDHWEPGCGIPVLALLFEEVSAMLANDDGDSFVRLCKEGRSAGVCVVASTQRPTYTAIPTEARTQFGGVVCFGVKESSDAGFALGDLVDRGADPSLWGQQHPGKAYLAAPGVDDSQHVMPLRTAVAKPQPVKAHVDALADACRTPLDLVSINAAGGLYHNRASDSDGGGVDEMEADMDDQGDVYGGYDRPQHDLDNPHYRPEDLPGYSDDDDLDGEDLPAGTDVPFGRPGLPPVSAEQARAIVDEILHRWENQSIDFRPIDLYDAAADAGRGRNWFRKLARELEDSGRLEYADRSAGIYRVAPRPDGHEGTATGV